MHGANLMTNGKQALMIFRTVTFNPLFIGAGLFVGASTSIASVEVVTTTTTLQALAQEITAGLEKNAIHVRSMTQGSQDPHFVSAKPSYMVQVRQADLLISIGMGLEQGWLPNILRGARNSKIQIGQPGHLVASTVIEPLEVLKHAKDRSHGHIHSEGNPHFLLDPMRGLAVAQAISKRLAEIAPEHQASLSQGLQKFESRLRDRLPGWKKRILKSGVREVVTYHKTLVYFFKQFGLKWVNSIEQKPGVPPTARHMLLLVEQMRKQGVKCILVEDYFETRSADKLAQSTGANVQKVSVEVGSDGKGSDYIEFIEALVLAVESCGPPKKHAVN